jgi:hypothetical protein
MEKFIALTVAVAILFALFGCTPHEQQLQQQGIKILSQGEFEQLFRTDRTAKTTTSMGTYIVKYYSDGRQEVDYGRGIDTGNFRIQGNQFCSSWKTRRGGEEECTKFYKVGEKSYELIRKDGSLVGTWEFN